MADPLGSVRQEFDRLAAWLAEHAPGTRESLMPAALEVRLEGLATEFRCVVPTGFLDLYRCAAGQRESAHDGIFNGYYFMPLEGVDGVETAWDQMVEMVERGARSASKDLYAFAKDFGGNYLCVEGASGIIVEIEEGEHRQLAPSMQAFLRRVTEALQEARSG